MEMTYELKHKELPAWLGILVVLAIITGIIILTIAIYVLQALIGYGGLYYIEFVALIIFAVWYAKTRLISFTYFLSGDILRIDRIYSRRPKLDSFIRMDQIVFMGQLKNLPEPYKKYRKQRETFKRISEDCFCVVYVVENKHFTALLSPSEAFEQALVSEWKTRTHQTKKRKSK